VYTVGLGTDEILQTRKHQENPVPEKNFCHSAAKSMLTDAASIQTRLCINLCTGWQASTMLVSHDTACSSSQRHNAVMVYLSAIVYSTASGHLFGSSIVARSASKQISERPPIQPLGQVVAILFLNTIQVFFCLLNLI